MYFCVPLCLLVCLSLSLCVSVCVSPYTSPCAAIPPLYLSFSAYRHTDIIIRQQVYLSLRVFICLSLSACLSLRLTHIPASEWLMKVLIEESFSPSVSSAHIDHSPTLHSPTLHLMYLSPPRAALFYKQWQKITIKYPTPPSARGLSLGAFPPQPLTQLEINQKGTKTEADKEREKTETDINIETERRIQSFRENDRQTDRTAVTDREKDTHTEIDVQTGTHSDIQRYRQRHTKRHTQRAKETDTKRETQTTK